MTTATIELVQLVARFNPTTGILTITAGCGPEIFDPGRTGQVGPAEVSDFNFGGSKITLFPVTVGSLASLADAIGGADTAKAFTGLASLLHDENPSVVFLTLPLPPRYREAQYRP